MMSEGRMCHYFWDVFVYVVVSVAVFWPAPLLSERLVGTTAHVTITRITTVPWANFKVKIWNQKTDESTLWHLKLNTEGSCHMIPLGDGAVQRGT